MFGVKDSESEANRAGLYAKIAEPHPIFDKYKDSESREENGNLFIVFRGASCFLQR